MAQDYSGPKVGVGMSGHDNLFNVAPINTKIFGGKRIVTG